MLRTQGCRSPQCRLLFGRCCVDLKKYCEAEQTLLSSFTRAESKGQPKADVTVEELVSEYGDSASFVAQLLGFVSVKTERLSRAIDFYCKSLTLNPFLWSSFQSLVQLGHKVDPEKVFNVSNVDLNLCYGSNPLISLWNSNRATECSLPAQTPQNVSLKDNHKAVAGFEINSPFAVIKSAAEPGLSIDVYTPESCAWVPAATLAPQKQNPNLLKSVRKACLTTQNTPDAVRSETPAARLSFGVFPLADQQKFCSSFNSSLELGDLNNKQADSYAKEIVPRVPKRHPSRRAQQQSAVTANSRSQQGHRMQIFSQSGNINQQQEQTGSSLVTPALTATTQSNNLRRSSRLFNSSSSVKENTKNASRNNENNKTAASSKTPPKKQRKQTSTSSSTSTTATITVARDKTQAENENELKSDFIKVQALNADLMQAGLKMQRSSAEGLMSLLRRLGEAQLSLGQFQIPNAIRVLKNLPAKHLDSGWVQSAMGRCYFELGQYTEAVKFYERAHEREPHRLQGLEYYSTALWHLQREVQLSMLSQQLVEFDKEAPQTWCVAGNCFSLQKEHETAIKFLQRAIQVDPDFAYAYTLLAHELVLTEEMDHAMACFRSAIRIDPRHYNAWYGIGMICFKQEKYNLAEVHYRKAVEISPNSPVLRCHLGVVLHSLKKTEQALQILDEAIAMDPNSALCRYHRASLYFAMDRHEEALHELETLKTLVPKESLVYFLIGKVCCRNALCVLFANLLPLFAGPQTVGQHSFSPDELFLGHGLGSKRCK